MPIDPPQRLLPPGVTQGLWDYVNRAAIADDYDDYFAHNRLFQLDEQVVLRQLAAGGTRPNSRVADFGCGTGRVLIALARHGYCGLGVDLSTSMLEIVRAKAQTAELPIECLRANLVELNCLRDHSCSAAVCLFSTLGMIQGRENRQNSLRHFRRIIAPGGTFVLHVHNYWYNLFDPGGLAWILRDIFRSSVLRDQERGDKYFHYRGVPNMFLHVFRRRELCQTLRTAGFRIQELIPLAPQRHRPLPWPKLCAGLRANGWIAVCR